MITTITCDRWEEAISARLDGELSAEESAALDAHLQQCPSCRTFENSAGALHRVVRVRPAEELPDLSDAILNPADPRRFTTMRITLGAAAAVALLAFAVGMSGLGDEEPAPLLAQIDGVATSAAAGSTSAVYLELVNDGGDDRLVGASAASAGRVDLHITEMHDGLMVMLERDDRPVSGHSTTIFGPGGSHVMLGSLADDLEPGDHLEITLAFARSGDRTISVPVVSHSDIPDAWWPGTA